MHFDNLRCSRRFYVNRVSDAYTFTKLKICRNFMKKKYFSEDEGKVTKLQSFTENSMKRVVKLAQTCPSISPQWLR